MLFKRQFLAGLLSALLASLSLVEGARQQCSANPELLDEQKKKAVEYADDQKMIDILNNWVSPMVEGEVLVKADDHGSRSNENLDNTMSGSGGSRKRKAGSLKGERKKKA